MANELVTRSIEELSGLLRNKEVSPVELTNAVIDQVEKYDGKINAYILRTFDKARAMASAAEKEITVGKYRGPLHGIPMAFKDAFYIKGEVTTMGSHIHKDFVPDIESTAITKLRDAGAVFTGKLNLHEYGYGGTTSNPHFGACHNPWNLEKIPGGSSGGSAAAVVADMAVASLGSDTVGSARIPAASCGVVGLKPTFGRVSKYGFFPLSWSFDHVGPTTKTVKDAAFLLEAISGYDAKDPTSVRTELVEFSKLLTGNVKGLRIGVNESYYFNNIDAGVEALVRRAIQALQDLGAEVVNVEIPELKYSQYVALLIHAADTTAIHHENLQIRPTEFGDDVRRLMCVGEMISAVDYVYAMQLRQRICLGFDRVMKDVDLLIGPTLPFTSPLIGKNSVLIDGKEQGPLVEHSIRLTGPANVTGLPSITVPCGLVDGMPAGLQLIGRAFREDVILNAAYAFEKTNPMHGAKPNL